MAREITYDNLSEQLVRAVPEIEPLYREELAYWRTGKPGQHIIFGDVLAPYIVTLAQQDNDDLLRRVFEFLETLLLNEDGNVRDVVGVSVVEWLASWFPMLMPKMRPLMGARLGDMIDAEGPYDKESVRARRQRFRELNPHENQIMEQSGSWADLEKWLNE